MVTGRWTLLRGEEIGEGRLIRFLRNLVLGGLPQEKMALQGVSSTEIEALDMKHLSDTRKSDLAGNAWGAQAKAVRSSSLLVLPPLP